MRIRFVAPFVGALALWLSACATEIPVGTTFDPLEAFPAEAIWRWDASANVLPGDERIVAMNLDPVLHDAIARELATRGYREANGQRPDYLVSYELGLASRAGSDTTTATASLSLLMRDFDTRRRVWLAFMRTEVDRSRSESERAAHIREVVARMLESFPPGHER